MPSTYDHISDTAELKEELRKKLAGKSFDLADARKRVLQNLPHQADENKRKYLHEEGRGRTQATRKLIKVEQRRSMVLSEDETKRADSVLRRLGLLNADGSLIDRTELLEQRKALPLSKGDALPRRRKRRRPPLNKPKVGKEPTKRWSNDPLGRRDKIINPGKK